MVNVPRKYGFELDLHRGPMREMLNEDGVKRLVGEVALNAGVRVEAHVRAAASAEDAENYVAALFVEDSYSADMGFDFTGPRGLGNRPIGVVGIRSTGPRGARRSETVNPDGKPPLMVEAETHALTSVPGFRVGSSGRRTR